MNTMNTIKRINQFSRNKPDFVTDDFSDYLMDNGYFEAPASKCYHGAYTGGLYDHSFTVTDYLHALTAGMQIQWQRKESPWVVGMFHDLCKMDDYITVVDNEGTYMFGSDEVKGKEVHFESNKEMLISGHGDKSIMLLSQFMTLTEEELLCIRYHMGAYNRDDWDGYDRAIRKYRTVLYTHTADMLASKVEGV